MDVASMLVGALAGVVAGAVVVLLLRRGKGPRASGAAAGIMRALGKAGSVSAQACVFSGSARGERGIIEAVYRMADGETIATAFFEDPAALGQDDPARALEQGYALLTRITCDDVCDRESVDRARESMREFLPGARLVPVPMDEAFTRLDGVFCKLADHSFLALVTLRGPSAPADNRSVVFSGDAARQLFDQYRALANEYRDRVVVEDKKEKEEQRKEPEPPAAPEKAAAPAEEVAAPVEEPPAPAVLSVERQPPAAEAPPPAPPLPPPSAPPPAVSFSDLMEKTQPPARQPAIRPERESAAAAPEPAPPLPPPSAPPPAVSFSDLPEKTKPGPAAPPAESPPKTEPEDKTPVALPALGDIRPEPERPAAEAPGAPAPAPPPVVIPERAEPAHEAPKPPPVQPAHHPAPVESATSMWSASAPTPGESTTPAPGGPAGVDNPLDFLVGTWSVIETREGRAGSHAATITEDGGYYIDGRQRYYLANIEYNVTLNEISFAKVRTEGGIYGKEVLSVEAHDVLRGNGQGGIRHTLLYERQA